MYIGIFNYLSGVHHYDSLGHLRNYSQIMSDHYESHSVLILKRLHELKYLRLNSHVKSSRGLIREKQFGITGERHRYHRPLAHPSREFVGIFIDPLFRFGNSNLLKHIYCHLTCLLFVNILMKQNSLHDLESYRKYWIESSHRFLKDHGHVVSSNLHHLGFRNSQDVFAVK